MTNIHCFDTQTQWQSAIVLDIKNTLLAALLARGQAGFFVSGGSTPAPFYQALSHCDLAWKNIHIGLVDERWVASDHVASNEKLIRGVLCQNKASVAPFTGMKTMDDTPHVAVKEVCARYQSLPHPDVVVLGMGDDGHVASLFPHAQGLGEGLHGKAPICALTAQQSAVTGEYVLRMSVSLQMIARANLVVLAIKGAGKWACLQTALHSLTENGLENNTFTDSSLPVRAVLRLKQLRVYWYE